MTDKQKMIKTRMQPLVMVSAATASAARCTGREIVSCTPTALLSCRVSCGVSPARSRPCAVTAHTSVSCSFVPASWLSSAFSSPNYGNGPATCILADLNHFFRQGKSILPALHKSTASGLHIQYNGICTGCQFLTHNE